MAGRRYFVNNMADSAGKYFEIPKEDIKTLCYSYLQRVFDEQTLTSEDADGGIYIGLAGVSYMCYYLAEHPEFAELRDDLLERSQYYLQYALTVAETPNLITSRAAFLFGGCGTYALAAAVYRALGKERESRYFLGKYVSFADGCQRPDFLGCGLYEVLGGRAGYLSGILFLQKVFGSEILPEDRINRICATIVHAGVNYSRRHRSPCPLMYAYHGTEYLGAAHGLSGILQVLLGFPKFLQRYPDAESLIKRSIDWLLSVQCPSGNFPCALEEVTKPKPESQDFIHWCHGAPGHLYQ
ncbi:lanC-like protein 3 isoform X2 [Argiope bruennichi]|uniref:lanC-like protein 3 isoform X2 n=1 Tax=Argiope bruennichi TaxID=94029 RepID=UPI00249422DF|nr:lanC-like protein 3 isoform X2 [Argiope bruennichi]XP_055927364.1 lanC-like protein 3 isoform X2 [Argiope bruennichi]